MLWYWSTRPRGSRANASVIGEGSAKWKIVTSPSARRRIGERPDIVAQLVVHGERENLGFVAEVAQQIA